MTEETGREVCDQFNCRYRFRFPFPTTAKPSGGCQSRICISGKYRSVAGRNRPYQGRDDLDLWMDTIHYGQGRVELLQITEAMNGRFAVANTGDLVDQNPAYWLLEKDFGNYLRMGPLNIEGIGNSAGLQLIIRNLLPWFDEPGAEARQVAEEVMIVLGN